MRCLPAIFALALAAISIGSAGAVEPSWQPSLAAAQWDFRFSPEMPDHPTAEGEGWRFSFPRYDGALPCKDHLGADCPSVHYLTTRAGGPLRGQSITMSIEVSGSGAFRFRLEPGNTCPGEATVRLLIERRNDDMRQEFHRWWSNPKAIVLAAGSHTLTIPLTPGEWSSVFGKKGDAAPEEFSAALEDAGAIGLTFGGGCFFGHGVNVTGGEATFVLKGLAISR